MMDPKMQAQLDAAARQRGFKDYAQFSAWSQRQAEMGPQGQTGRVPPRPAPQQQQPQVNWLQKLLNALNVGG